MLILAKNTSVQSAVLHHTEFLISSEVYWYL